MKNDHNQKVVFLMFHVYASLTTEINYKTFTCKVGQCVTFRKQKMSEVSNCLKKKKKNRQGWALVAVPKILTT
jgi:hypothetical protein